MHPRWLGSWPSSNMSSEFSTGSRQIVNACWTLHATQLDSYDDGKISGRVFQSLFHILAHSGCHIFYVILKTKVIIFLLF